MSADGEIANNTPTQMPTDASSLQSLGRRVRELRRQRGMSVEALSGESGVSTGLISMVERGKANPSFSTLVALTRGLGVSLSWLFDEGARSSPVVRKDQRLSVAPRVPGAPGAVRQLLTPDAPGIMEGLWLEFLPGQEPGQRHQHEGEDFILVVSGRLDAYIGDARYVLEAGDTIRFPGQEPHTYGNSGTETCTLALVSVLVEVEKSSRR